MPVDLGHSRFGAHGNIGVALVWDCPACGVRNEGRPPERGCVQCGAGDPTKGSAGHPALTERYAGGEALTEGTVTHRVPPVVSVPLRSVESATKIYRLLEYVVTRPEDVQIVLRNSLVGRLEMGWGTLTGTIVDSLDATQEDRLRMARMQPGVWLANPAAMAQQDHQAAHIVAPLLQRRREMETLTELEQAAITKHFERNTPMTVEPPALEADKVLAERLQNLGSLRWGGDGLAFTHTLALALSNAAVELAGNTEPEKFLSSAECMRLAQALMALIPSEWNPQPEQTDRQA